MRISVNGQGREIAAGTTLSQLLAGLDLGGMRVAVERNLNIVPRNEYDATVLAEGDRLEVVTFVGGG